MSGIVKSMDFTKYKLNGKANPAAADPGGMTNDEKSAVGGLLRNDAAKGAAVHVGTSSSGVHTC